MHCCRNFAVKGCQHEINVCRNVKINVTSNAIEYQCPFQRQCVNHSVLIWIKTVEARWYSIQKITITVKKNDDITNLLVWLSSSTTSNIYLVKKKIIKLRNLETEIKSRLVLQIALKWTTLKAYFWWISTINFRLLILRSHICWMINFRYLLLHTVY